MQHQHQYSMAWQRRMAPCRITGVALAEFCVQKMQPSELLAAAALQR